MSFDQKVLIITNMPAPYQVAYFDRLAREGLNIEVIYTRRSSPGRRWKINENEFKHKHTILKEIRIWNNWYFNYGLRKVFSAVNRNDVIVVAQYASISMQIAMIYASFRKGKKRVFWSESIEGVDFEERPLVSNGLLALILRRLALLAVKRFADEYWAIGDKAARSYQKLLGARHIKKLYYYQDLESYSKFLKKPLSSAEIRFAYIGSKSIRKGFDLLLEAIEIFNESGIFNFEVGVIGSEGADIIFDNGKVKFHGFVQSNRVPSVLSDYEVLLFPTRYDGWGLVVPECLSLGIPVISTLNSGAAEELINERTGVLLKELSASSLSKAMQVYSVNRDVYRPEDCREQSQHCDLSAGVEHFKQNLS